ncbi:hypothetical protein ScPMuIL_004530 [Solemya velum]
MQRIVRDGFTKYRRKIKSKSDDGSSNIKEYKYSKVLAFLIPFQANQKTPYNLQETDYECPDSPTGVKPSSRELGQYKMIGHGRFLAHACKKIHYSAMRPVSIAGSCYSTTNFLVSPVNSRGISRDIPFNYEREKRTFSLQVPEYYNFTRDMIDMWAEKESRGLRGDNPAFWWIDENGNELKWSFKELSEKSKKVANLLTGPGMLKPDDIMILILPRVPQWWLINLGAIRAGIVLSPGTTLLTSKDILYRTKASKAKCIITDAAGAENVGKIAMEIPELKSKILVGDKIDRGSGWLNFDDLLSKSEEEFETINSRSSDPSILFFTSGTTGSPKMAEHTHSSYGLGHKITARYFLNLMPKDVIWNLSDTGWAKCAWSSLFAPWINGSCIFVHHSKQFNPEDTLRILQNYPMTHFCAAPTLFRILIMADLKKMKLDHLRYCFSAGEPVNPELLAEWEKGTGIPLYEGYGQTETTFLCGTDASIKQKPGSMGKAAPGVDLQIVDDLGNILPRGTEGHIAVRYRPERPVGLFNRYVDDEERNNKSILW